MLKPSQYVTLVDIFNYKYLETKSVTYYSRYTAIRVVAHCRPNPSNPAVS